ncbi:MAG: glycine cleavage system protein GcvH [Calditrichaceae bacterium]|nr:glycine cleavage system protein GcvH [Calditrichaceae bacterium]
MNIPSDLKYTKDHEWIKVDGDTATVGITDYAQGELGDVVYVELPEEGAEVSMNEAFGSIEAVKAVADIFSPVSGEVIEINEAIQDEPEKVNQDAYGAGWMVKIRLSNPDELSQLMDAAAYKEHIS